MENEANSSMELVEEEGKLTEYELERKPLPLLEKSSDIEISRNILNQELTCPICLSIIQETRTVMGCLHRFCAGCITKCLRIGNKECPTCRRKCSSHRHLRTDERFDAIIKLIYPNLDQYEEENDVLISEINASIDTSAYTASVKEGILRQSSSKKRLHHQMEGKKQNEEKNKKQEITKYINKLDDDFKIDHNKGIPFSLRYRSASSKYFFLHNSSSKCDPNASFEEKKKGEEQHLLLLLPKPSSLSIKHRLILVSKSATVNHVVNLFYQFKKVDELSSNIKSVAIFKSQLADKPLSPDYRLDKLQNQKSREVWFEINPSTDQIN